MCGLFIQEDIDREVSIVQYFVSRVVKLINNHDITECDYFSVSNRTPIQHKSVTDVSGLTRSSLISKYNNIIDVLQKELDYIDDQEIYLNWQQSILLCDDTDDEDEDLSNEIMFNKNESFKTVDSEQLNVEKGEEVRLRRSSRQTRTTEVEKKNHSKIKTDDNHDSSKRNRIGEYEVPTKKKRCISKTLQCDISTDAITELADDLDVVDHDDVKFTATTRRLSAKMAKASLMMPTMDKHETNTWKDANRKYQSMQTKVERLEEKLLINEMKMSESLKRKEDKLKLLQEKSERKRKRAELLKNKRKHLSWIQQFEKLVQFYKENGHSAPNSKTSKLGAWVIYQRNLYKHKSPVLTPEREQMLNSIGFEWGIRDHVPFAVRVNGGIQQHQENVSVTQDCTIASKQEQHAFEWMRSKVEYYKNRIRTEGKPNQNELYVTRFAERLTELSWVKEKGCSMNDKQSILSVFPNNTTLIAWAKCIRRCYKLLIKGKPTNLTSDRAALLTELGFDFYPRKHYAPPGSKKKNKKSVNVSDQEEEEEEASFEQFDDNQPSNYSIEQDRVGTDIATPDGHTNDFDADFESRFI